MTDYSRGKIYAIIDKKNDLCYVGSTVESLNQRLSKHLTDFKGYMGELPTFRSYRGSFEVLIQDDYEMHLIKNYPCNSLDELHLEESKWIFKMSEIYEVTNKNLPKTLGYKDLEDINNLVIPTKLYHY